MTDQKAEVTVPATDEVSIQDELTSLKQQAKILGVSHHPSIGVNKLRVKVRKAMSDDLPKIPQETISKNAIPLKETKLQRVTRLRKEASLLVRIRVTCMNPDKREWSGEIFTASNSVVGTYKKYVPFNNDEGWHVPQIIVNMIKERKCQVFRNEKDINGRKVMRGKLIDEFAIDIMPSLTSEEVNELARKQAMSGSIAN